MLESDEGKRVHFKICLLIYDLGFCISLLKLLLEDFLSSEPKGNVKQLHYFCIILLFFVDVLTWIYMLCNKVYYILHSVNAYTFI